MCRCVWGGKAGIKAGARAVPPALLRVSWGVLPGSEQGSGHTTLNHLTNQSEKWKGQGGFQTKAKYPSSLSSLRGKG